MLPCYIRRIRFVIVLALFALYFQTAHGGNFSQTEASDALKRAVVFYRTKVGVRGGYGYTISDDLSKREGENRTSNSQAWIEPPATPAIGMAYLQAYQLTGDQYLLDAALETASCLVDTQLVSGGWQNPIETDPVEKRSHPYRKNPLEKSTVKIKQELTTLDDNKTQSCLTFLIRLDVETRFQQAAIHEAVMFGLDAIIRAQYPNGAWPQQFAGPSKSTATDNKKASYPETWSRIFPAEKYTELYTFNDNTIADVVALMLEASISYNDDRYLKSAAKAGGFIVTSQMPEPQPGWAQQYDSNMQPAWARKFEPPSVSGSESQSLIKILMVLYRHTGDRKFLEPIERSLDWLNRSKLPDGILARFYELKTNKPLYFTKNYELTYDDSDLPTHYSFKVGSSSLGKLQSEYTQLVTAKAIDKPTIKRPKLETFSLEIGRSAEKVAKQMDDRGAWVEDGRLKKYGENDSTKRIITSKNFISNIRDLARCASAK